MLDRSNVEISAIRNLQSEIGMFSAFSRKSGYYNLVARLRKSQDKL
jgi:hypothetical protein